MTLHRGRFAPPRADAPAINRDRLVTMAVAGQIANAIVRPSPHRVARDGVLRVVPGTGGIALDRRIGDRAVGLAGDHVEPGVALRNNDREGAGAPGGANRGLLAYSCVGNVARVITGPAQGAIGVVTGKHGGINHTLVDFPTEVLRRLRIGDRVQINALGQGMQLRDFPDVRALNLSPALLRRWGLRAHGRHLHVPVTHVIPSGIMGSGLGRSDGVLGDCDIQLSDRALVRRLRLHEMRFGDLVAVCNLDSRFGPTVRPGTVTVGVIVHSDSHVAGHGPGLTPLLVGPLEVLRPTHDGHANIALRLGVRESIAPSRAPSTHERATHWRIPGLCARCVTEAPSRAPRSARLERA